MSDSKVGKTMESLAKGLDNFSKLIVANKKAASGDVEPEIASTGNMDPSGVNQNYTPKKVSPENIGYSSQNSETSSSTVEDSDMVPVVEGSDISQTEKAVRRNGQSLDKIISKLEADSGVSKSKKLKKDEDEDNTDLSESDIDPEDSDVDVDIDEKGEDVNISDDDGDISISTSSSDEDEIGKDVDENTSSSEEDESTEKAVYIEVNDLVKGVLSETGIERKLYRIEKSLQDHERGFKHLAKAVVQIAKALRSVKNESREPIRKSVPSVKASVNTLNKAVIADKLFNLAKDGKISSTEVLKFETAGTLSEDAKRMLNI